MRVSQYMTCRAASWMRPLLCGLTLFLGGRETFASAEALPAAKADLIRSILARSIKSQIGHNIRGRQVEWTPTSRGMQITYKKYTRTDNGRALAVVTDSDGARINVMADDGQWNRSYDPKTSTLTESRSMRVPTDDRSIKKRIHRILSSYRVRYMGLEVMAGRQCHKLSLDPYDQHGRPIKVWIDANTGVTLGREESDRRGNFVGLTLFLSISYPSKLNASETSLSVPAGTRIVRVSNSPQFASPGALRKWSRIEVLLPASMPKGYEFESGELVLLAGVPTVCMRYSDGLAVITLFQTQSARAVQPRYQSVAWKMLPRGESMAVSGQTRVTTVVIGPRETDGIVSIARALDRERENHARGQIGRLFGVNSSQIQSLRDRGYGLDCIAALLEISRQSGRRLGDLISLKEQGWDWKQIAVKHKIVVDRLLPIVRQYECR